MTDPMAMALIRLVVALARYAVRGGNGKAVLEAADRAEQACNERARIP